MAIRLNNAKNFKGKAYVAADELDNLIKSMSLAGVTTSAINAADTWKINFTNIDGTAATTSAVDLTAIKDYIDNKSITVSAGDGIVIDSSDPLDPVIATKIKLVKLGTATTGYAASYKLQVWDHTANSNAGDWKDAGDSSATIDIVKDQFIKSAAFGWSTAADSTGAGWTSTKSDSAKYPCIKIEVYTNTDGDLTNEQTATTTLYVPLNDVFVDQIAGDYIDSTALTSRIIKVNVGNGIDGTDTTAIKVLRDGTSEQVYTALNTPADVLTIGASGVKIANIQAAIDNAITTEHNTASAAIETLKSQVSSFENSTSAAVDALNTRIEAVATNAATAAGNAQANAIAYASGVADNAQTAVQTVGSAVDALDGRLQTAISDVNTNVEAAIDSAITNVNTAISANVDSVNTNVSAVASGLNDRIATVAGNAQTTANALEAEIVALDSKVDGAFAALDTAVESAIDAVQSSVTTHTANAVQMLEADVTPTAGTGENSAVYTATQTANNIVAVYCSGIQIYPEISRTGDAAPYTYSLEADYGTAQTTAEPWTILYTVALSAYTGVDVADTSYDVTASAAKTVGAGDAATYTNVTKTDAASVDATDVEYTATADVDGTTVGQGTAGTSATTVANGTAATAPENNADVEKEEPVYKTGA